uniref:Rhodanese domain-containing protein n=1 Tax=Cyclophora tenuis TaxID=216820 RepID=A0A7S1DE33_CYCTE|mmetsp:Transcript_9776/g.16330  ORF Transcript_9776/g.16330 Transcript_9776/m.16330 type:complete len:123 (+) Transcript_9776:621-989(+)
MNDIKIVGKEGMEAILQDYEESGRDESGYIVIDVRNQDEVVATGKLSPSVVTLPLGQVVAGAFSKSADDFEDSFGFDKPAVDETLVFTCLAGKRAQTAAETVKAMGYSQILVYGGGAKEWFA